MKPMARVETAERCNHPLGQSGSLSVVCALPVGHDGSHRSVFSAPLASSSPASSGSTVGMEPVVRGLPSPPGSRTTDGFDEKETR